MAISAMTADPERMHHKPAMKARFSPVPRSPKPSLASTVTPRQHLLFCAPDRQPGVLADQWKSHNDIG
jgi:hypothetical protein